MVDSAARLRNDLPMLRRLRVLLTVVLASTGLGADLLRHDFSGPGMATVFRIACYAEDAQAAAAAAERCYQRVAELNARFTDYDPASELMRLCAPGNPMPAAVSEPMFDLLLRARELAEATGGAFDPTCGHLSHLWRRSKRTGRLPPSDRLAQGILATDWHRITLVPEGRKVRLAPGTLIDLGGIAKGRAADECLRLLKECGITRAVVQAGGDTVAGDPPPGQAGWEVVLRTGSSLETRIRLAGRAVSTSGDLHQFIELDGRRYSHILSPRTGLGLTERIACSVIAPDCTTSDALATAMCVLGEEAGMRLASRLPGVEVRFSRPDSNR